MFPYIYRSESLSIGSYGVMLAIAYLLGRHLYIRNLNLACKAKINTEALILSLLVFGVIGAKLMFLIKNPQQASLFSLDSLVSGSGFSSQGALLAAILVTLFFSRVTRVKLDLLLDAAAPAAVLAYAIARVGCFLAGDDCYGIDSNLPWAMAFPNGIHKTAPGQLVHPLPLYEVIYSLAIWQYLEQKQKIERKPYYQFFRLLLLWGFCRFWIEMFSTNPTALFGMSGSQVGALLMFMSALAFFIWKKQGKS